MQTAICQKTYSKHGISRSFCRRLHTAVSQLKEQLISRYETTASSGWRIREALSTAETQAWETPFPHLFFPDLAEVHLAPILNEQEATMNRHA